MDSFLRFLAACFLILIPLAAIVWTAVLNRRLRRLSEAQQHPEWETHVRKLSARMSLLEERVDRLLRLAAVAPAPLAAPPPEPHRD